MRFRFKYLICLILILLCSYNISYGLPFFKKKPKSPPPELTARDYADEYMLNLYNDPPGTQNIDLSNIQQYKIKISPAVISPDMKNAAFTEVYFYPRSKQTASRALWINLQQANNFKSIDLLDPKSFNRYTKTLMTTGMDRLYKHDSFRTLTVVDWSADSKKILLKEIIGKRLKGISATRLWVYNFKDNSLIRLNIIRSAITYYWKKKAKIRLYEYVWDIEPLGWSLSEPDYIVVNSYGYSRIGKKSFLGSWKVHHKNIRSELISLHKQKTPVSRNGFFLTRIKEGF